MTSPISAYDELVNLLDSIDLLYMDILANSDNRSVNQDCLKLCELINDAESRVSKLKDIVNDLSVEDVLPCGLSIDDINELLEHELSYPEICKLLEKLASAKNMLT